MLATRLLSRWSVGGFSGYRALLAGAALGLTLLLCWLGNDQFSAARGRFDAAERRVQTAARDLQARRGLAAAAADLAASRQRLENSPGHGAANRQAWLAAVRRAAAALHLPLPACEILPLRQSENGLWQSARMTLRSGLRHEGELLALLDGIRRQAPALLEIHACRLALLPVAGANLPAAEPNPNVARLDSPTASAGTLAEAPADSAAGLNLEADCQLEWHNFRLPGEEK